MATTEAADATEDTDVTDAVDDVVQRVAMLALMYYPEIQVDVVDFNVGKDIDWCLEDLEAGTATERAEIRDLVGRAIIDPTAHREALLGGLYALILDQD